MTNSFEKLLTVTDIMTIFDVSRPTVYRWISLSRRGYSRFPLPIGDAKQGLRWNPDDIRAFQNGANPPPLIPESNSERSKRHNTAMKSLAKQGVILPSQK